MEHTTMVNTDGRIQAMSVDLEKNADSHAIPQSRWYWILETLMLVLALMSIWISPVQFAFYEMLSKYIIYLDIAHIIFAIDMNLQILFVDTWYQKLRYICYNSPNIVACVPWILVYHLLEGNIVVRWFILSRMYRVRKLIESLPTKPLKTLALYIILFHVGGCFFYYSAISGSPHEDENTWIGSLTLGKKSYSNFREMTFGEVYTTSIYLACMTVMTVGYGDIHPVNRIEMIIAITLMLATTYLIDCVADSNKEENSQKNDQKYQEFGPDSFYKNWSPKLIHEAIVSNSSTLQQQSPKRRFKIRKWVPKVKKVARVVKVKKVAQQPISLGQTPVHGAALDGDLDRTQKADVDVLDNDGIKRNDEEMVSIQKEKGDAKPYVSSIPSSDNTLASIVATHGDIEGVNYLLRMVSIKKYARKIQSKVFVDLYEKRDKEALSFSYDFGYEEHQITYDFWEKLLCHNKDLGALGWLDDDHIDIWGHMLLKTNQRNSYTIMPTQFMIGQCHSSDKWINLARGSYAPYRPWCTIDLVVLPLNENNNHWLLAILDLKKWSFTVYDSCRSEIRNKWVKKVVDTFDINNLLKSIAYWETSGREPTRVNLNLQFVDDIPQQTNNMDCGVFVCLWFEAFLSGKRLKIKQGGVGDHCFDYRRKMAAVIWAQRHFGCR